MNRLGVVPPPPGLRESPGGSDWKTKIREVTWWSLMHANRHGTLDQALLKNSIIMAARMALGDYTNDELADDYEAAQEDERTIEEITLAIRYVAQHHVPQPIDPLTIETIMAEIQRAMDLEFTRALDVVVRLLAARYWSDSGEPPLGHRDKVVARIVREAREALGCEPDDGPRQDDPRLATIPYSVDTLRKMLGGFDLTGPERVGFLLASIERSAGAEMSRDRPGSDD